MLRGRASMAALCAAEPLDTITFTQRHHFGSLSSRMATECCAVALGHHGEHLAGVAVHGHRHVPVPLAHRGLVHQQHPAPALPVEVVVLFAGAAAILEWLRG
ncbi:hypothetical protein [Candidatus Poriferisodalis sp.]|uniref:hypothetical protein n=1 Tax=Candidatus Poriferisodalis sp. TaxID=3101277 RepID=UPI003B01CEF1